MKFTVFALLCTILLAGCHFFQEDPKVKQSITDAKDASAAAAEAKKEADAARKDAEVAVAEAEKAKNELADVIAKFKADEATEEEVAAAKTKFDSTALAADQKTLVEVALANVGGGSRGGNWFSSRTVDSELRMYKLSNRWEVCYETSSYSRVFKV